MWKSGFDDEGGGAAGAAGGGVADDEEGGSMVMTDYEIRRNTEVMFTCELDDE